MAQKLYISIEFFLLCLYIRKLKVYYKVRKKKKKNMERNPYAGNMEWGGMGEGVK